MTDNEGEITDKTVVDLLENLGEVDPHENPDKARTHMLLAKHTILGLVRRIEDMEKANV